MSSRLASFDVFDTLLTRAVGAPGSVFFLMGRLEVVAQITRCTPEQFANLRISAERRARRGRREITLHQIYRELGAGLNLTTAERAQLEECELTLEYRLSRVVPAAPEMLKRSTAARKVALSDMYLPASFVTGLLEQQGLAQLIDRVIVSSEHGVTKGDGGLYDLLLETEQVSSKDSRHAGDNPMSDVRVPRFLGLGATHHTAAKLNRYEQIWESQRSETAGLSSLVAGASRLARLRTDGPAERAPIIDVAAGVAAPILCAYVLWVLQSAQREGIRRLYFLARDGEVLYLLAQRLATRMGLDIDLRYLYGSRNVYHRAGLAAADLHTAGWAWSAMYRLTPLAVLKRLGLPEEQARATLDRLGRDRPVPEHATPEVVERLISDEQVGLEVRTAAEQLRDRVQGYLRQEGMFDGVPRAIVDTGWAGRIAQSLSDIFPADVEPLTRGYLFGYMKRDDGYRTPDVLRGYLFDEFAETGYWGRFEQAYGPLETFTVADHGMTVDFVERDGRFGPVLASAHNPVLEAWPWQLFRDTLFHFVDALVLDPDLAAVEADLRSGVAGVLTAFWLDPTEDEARTWGAYVYEDDILATSRNPLAQPIFARDFIGKANQAYEGKRLWMAASVKLSPPAVRPAARVGLWFNERRRSGPGPLVFLSERWRGRLRLMSLAAKARDPRRKAR